MKRYFTILTMITNLLISFLVATTLWAQVQPIQFKNLDAPPVKIQPMRIIKHPPIPAQIKPEMIKINRLQPIPFRPFTLQELRHPMTHPTKAGQPIHPDDEITCKAVVNGKVERVWTIKGRDLLNEINKLEQQYNALGYTIRRAVKTPIVINESIIKRDLLQRQRQDSIRKFRPPTLPVKALKFANLQGRYANEIHLLPKKIEELTMIQSSLGDTIPQPISKEERYDDEWGDRDFFAAGIHGRVSLYADKNIVKTQAEGKATATIFNHDFTILSIVGGSDGPIAKIDGEMHAYLRVTALGDDLISPIDKRGRPPLPVFEDDQFLEVDESVKLPVVSLGPFSINVTLGFHGRAGIRYGLYLTPASTQAMFMPYLETSAYGQAGLNVWLLVSVEAGVGAKLTLLNDYLPLCVTAGIGFDQPKPYFFYEYYAKNTIETLSGEIYAYVTVDYYIDSDTWKWTIFDWDGFRYDGYVIGPVSYNVPIKPKEEQDAWQVTVYEHVNYGGQSKTFTIYPGRCQAMDVALSASGWNDKISSVKVGKNVSVFLFEHVAYCGRHLRLDESAPDLHKFNFNDKASSIIVFPKSMGNPVGVWLIGNNREFSYIHDEVGDVNICSCKSGATHHPKVHYNDNATKIIIPRINPQSPPWGYIEVILYEHDHYKGRSVKFRAGPEGAEFTLPPELSKKVSSIEMILHVNDPKLLRRPSW